MQPLRTSVGQVSRQLNRNMKSISPRHFTSTPAAMSLFPRFSQEFSPIFRFFDEYDRQAFQGMNRQLNQVRSFTPKFDVKETTEGYELHGELPGVEQKDINIEWTDSNTLTISGRHEHVREEGSRPQALENSESHAQKKVEHQPTVEDAPAQTDKETEFHVATESDQSATIEQQRQQQEATRQQKYWVSERTVGEFHRSFSFPARVEQDAVKASLKNGILSIVIPRGAAPQTKKILIE